MRVLRDVLSVIDSLSRFSGIIFGFVVWVLTGIVIYEVVGRFVFHVATGYCFELAQVAFMGYFIMGGAYTLLYNGHVRMDLVFSRLSEKNQAILDLITAGAFFLFVGLLAWKGAQYAWVSTMRLETTGMTYEVPMWEVMWALPVASGLLILQGAAKFIRDLHFVMTGSRSI